MAAIQIVNEETLSDKKYPLKYITLQKPDREGNMRRQQKEVYYRPDAVSILLVDKQARQFLFTRQFRLAAFLNGNDSGYLLEACAGMIDETETPEQTAAREVVEETGYEISGLEKTGAVYTSPAGITEYVHLFVANYKSESSHAKRGGLASEGEDIELVEMDFDEALQKLQSGQIKDAKTLMLLQHYFLANK
jgi:nudix-type nucleoside diphosphatase (YffH/AdpP family)